MSDERGTLIRVIERIEGERKRGRREARGDMNIEILKVRWTKNIIKFINHVIEKRKIPNIPP